MLSTEGDYQDSYTTWLSFFTLFTTKMEGLL